MAGRAVNGSEPITAVRRSCWRAVAARLGLAAAVACTLPAPLLAQRGYAVVRVEGRPLLRIAVDSATDPRTQDVERRLAALVGAPDAPPPAKVMPARADTIDIVVGAVNVIGATARDAEENLLAQDSLARKWARLVDSAIVSSRAQRGNAPLRFAASVRAAFRASLSRMAERSGALLPGVLAALALLAVTSFVASALRRSTRLLSRRFPDATVENLVRHIAFYTVWAVGAVVALEAVGVPVQALLTGLGITGLALGFALRDVLSNFISGLLLLAFRPFALGDEIVVGQTEGRVLRIELRATEIRTFDGRTVIVPNADLLTSIVTNNSASPMRRGEIRCPIAYGDDLQKAIEQLRGSVAAVSGVARDPPVGVRMEELGQHEIWVRVLYWFDTRAVDLISMRDAVGLALVEGLARGGFTLPSPQRRRVLLRVERDPRPNAGVRAGADLAMPAQRPQHADRPG